MDRSVVITGCSTGIGRASALHLARQGWRVFAGVRKETDAKALEDEGAESLTPVILDVVDKPSIDKTAELVAEEVGNSGLDGLVNNAGVSVYGALEYLDPDELDRQLQVNVTAQIVVTQAFLPLIRKATGRIVFVGSSAGRAPSAPFFGPYTASKYALEAIFESLRLELMPWGIKCSIIEPGAIESAIWDKGMDIFEEQLQALPEEGRARYEDAMRRGHQIADFLKGRAIPAQKVATKIEHALTAKRPRNHYLVGADAVVRAYTESLTPKPVRDRVVGRFLNKKPGDGAED